MMKKVKVVRKKQKADTTEKSLSVQSYSEYEMLLDWNKNHIIDVLKREANVKEKLAIKIADSVEKKVLKLEIKKISTDFIRSLIDEELMLHGKQKKLVNQKVLGIPTYDLEQSLFQKTQENSNIQTNTPETINMYIAETILKQYALNKVFSKTVSDAHMKGHLHLHDLGLVDRVYSFDGTLNYIKVKNKQTNEELYVNFIYLYNIVDGEEIYNKELDAYEKFPDNWLVEDINGFVDITRVLKHEDERDLLKITLEDNKSIIVTEDHPCVVYKNGKKMLIDAKDLKENDEFYIK